VITEYIDVADRGGAKGDVATYTMPPAGKVKLDYAGYFFFASDKMKEKPDPSGTKSVPGAFVEGQQTHVELSKEKMRPANKLGMRDVGNLRVLVEKVGAPPPALCLNASCSKLGSRSQEARKWLKKWPGTSAYIMVLTAAPAITRYPSFITIDGRDITSILLPPQDITPVLLPPR